MQNYGENLFFFFQLEKHNAEQRALAEVKRLSRFPSCIMKYICLLLITRFQINYVDPYPLRLGYYLQQFTCLRELETGAETVVSFDYLLHRFPKRACFKATINLERRIEVVGCVCISIEFR